MAIIHLIGMILGILTMILVITMLFHFIKNEYNFASHRFRFWKNGYHIILFILIFISYIIFSLHTTVNSAYATIHDSFSALWCLSYIHEMWFFTIGKILLYLFFVLRLHSVFKDSAFAVSTIKLKSIAFMVVFPLIAASIFFTIAAEIVDSSINWNSQRIQTFATCDIIYEQYETPIMLSLRIFFTVLYVIMELIFSIIILRLFLSRVMLVSIGFDEKSVTLLNLAIKTTNVIIMAVCTNYIMLIKYGLTLPASILNVDVFFNCLSVYLSYAFASKYYDILFGVCHQKCYKCCIKLCYCCCVKHAQIDAQISKKQEVHSEISDIELGK
eukprot:495130_1